MSYNLYYPDSNGWNYYYGNCLRLQFVCSPVPNQLKTNVTLNFQTYRPSNCTYRNVGDTGFTVNGNYYAYSVFGGALTSQYDNSYANTWVTIKSIDFIVNHSSDGTGSFPISFTNLGNGFGALGIRYYRDVSQQTKTDCVILSSNTSVTITLNKIVIQNGAYDFQVYKNGSWSRCDSHVSKSGAWQIDDPQIYKGGWK